MIQTQPIRKKIGGTVAKSNGSEVTTLSVTFHHGAVTLLVVISALIRKRNVTTD